MSYSNIRIMLTVPFSDDKDIRPSIGFCKWIPERTEDNLVRKTDGVTVTLSVDKECVADLGEITDEHLQRCMNNHIDKVYIAVDLDRVDKELASFILDEKDSAVGKRNGLYPDEPKYAYLSNEYKRLGELSLKSAINACNRLISFARDIKGQYWLDILDADRENILYLNNLWRAEASIDSGNKFRWAPPGTNEIIHEFYIDSETTIKQEEWSEVREFFNSNSRPRFVLTLLSNARYLKDQGHKRSAVIDCVTALEVAVNEFGKSPKIDDLCISEYKSRIDMKNLGKQFDHLGFSGSLRYLVPILLNYEELSNDVLDKCYDAITVRNNVVHNGQKDVDDNLLNEIIIAVSYCCKVLDKYTKKKNT